MKHFVLMKFKKEYLTKDIFEDLTKEFMEIANVLSGISSCYVEKNIVARAENMDVMVIMELKNKKELVRYLNHPLHIALAEKYSPHIEKRISFDC